MPAVGSRRRGAGRALGFSALATVLTTAAALGALGGLGACSDAGPRARGPSILLFVFDTVRADALARPDVAPEAKRLAREGVRYVQARANAPWTLPSHVSLFSGLRPSRHGVHWRRPRLPDDLQLLAQRLRRAGYQTWAYSENPWISPGFGFARGFDHFDSGDAQSGPAGALSRWWPERDPSRPLFAFVNVMDAHWPYTARDHNRFLPEGVTDADAGAQAQWPPDLICTSGSDVDRARALLHGLYLGDVAAADAKLASLGHLLEGEPDLIRIVTADHGELFGEDQLSNHQFSVHEALLRVPLVVHGLEGAPPGVVSEAVTGIDLLPSILAWAGLDVPAGLPGRVLPLPDDPPRDPRALVAEYRDPAAGPQGGAGAHLAALTRAQAESFRSHCRPEHAVWGDQAALIRGRHKLVWRAGAPSRLFDIATDPAQRHDRAPADPQRVAALEAELARLWRDDPEDASGLPPLDPATQRRLEALGYLGKD